MNKKIVHWIVGATAHYLNTLKYSLKSLHNLLPPEQYTFRVTIITNSDNGLLPEINNIINLILNDYEYFNILEVEYRDCPDFPWPVITLYKPFLCNKFIREDDDFVLCGNCNYLINPNDYSWFEPDKICVSWHHTHRGPYYNSRPYYIQGNFVFAPKNLMQELCNDWQDGIDHFIKFEHIVPDWHDETILNNLFNYSEKYKGKFSTTFKTFADPNKKEPEAFIQLVLTHVDNKFKGEKWCS